MTGQDGRAGPAAKEALRRRALLAREALAAGLPRAGEAMAELFLSRIALPEGAVIAGYWPIGSEADPRPLLDRLRRCGHPLCLPQVEKRDRPLLFRSWRPGQTLVQGPHGTSQPSAEAPLMQPAILLVPLLAFDRRGARLGYGGGYYDRTLSAFDRAAPVLAVGLAFAGQEADLLPAEPHDRRLDWIVTETEAIRVQS